MTDVDAGEHPQELDPGERYDGGAFAGAGSAAINGTASSTLRAVTSFELTLPGASSP